MTRGPDIARVRARGSRIRGDFVELRVIRSAGGNSRIGLVVPRHKQSAVERNKVKRRLREVIRVVRTETPLDGDAVIVAGPRAYAASFSALQQELTAIWKRATVGQERS